MSETQLLLDPMTEPDEKVLEAALGRNYARYRAFEKKINEQNTFLEWHYYRDTKSWLCKVLNKKKNLCWLTVWDSGFKLTFYLPERLMDGFYKLDIDDEIKKAAKDKTSVGKSHPILIAVKNNAIINDVLKIMDFKLKIK